MIKVGDKRKLSLNATFPGGLEILAGTEVLVHKVDTSIPGITQLVLRVGMFQFTADPSIVGDLVEAPAPVPDPAPAPKPDPVGIQVGDFVLKISGYWEFDSSLDRQRTKRRPMKVTGIVPSGYAQVEVIAPYGKSRHMEWVPLSNLRKVTP